VLIWRYLARKWTVCLAHQPRWIPDQTTYFINVASLTQAYPLFLLFNSEFANQMITSLAERGKDRFFFFYAHTCRQLAIPPGLDQILPPTEQSSTTFLPSHSTESESRQLARLIQNHLRVENKNKRAEK